MVVVKAPREAGIRTIVRHRRVGGGVVARTRARVEAALRAEAGRRWEDMLLAFLALLAWTVGLATWAVWRLVTAGPAGLAAFGLTESLMYLTVSTLVAWLTAGVTAVVAGQRRRAVGRSL